jgi:hypothetical protein
LLKTIAEDMPDMAIESDLFSRVEKDLHVGWQQVEGAALRVLHSLPPMN